MMIKGFVRMANSLLFCPIFCHSLDLCLLNSSGEFVASSSCDGSVKMWDLQMSVTVASWNVVPKTNSFSSSLTLCRMAWTPDGQYLLVPAGMQVNAYARKNWQIHHSLEHESIKEVCPFFPPPPPFFFVFFFY